MAARRGKSQARRNHGHGSNRLPGWAWLVLGVLLTIGVILAAPKFLKSDGHDGFFRPRPNPDAQPAATTSGEDGEAIIIDTQGADDSATDAAPKETTYDFYTLLPGEEVALSDAQLAASARAEAERAARAQPQPTATTTASTPTSAAPATTASTDNARYILQAGAFQASGDAEEVKARIALLGLSARVESAVINDKTMYRVRMGPYGTASELAEAKRKLANGGLPALAIKAK
jgi:cell division protein FtsN